MVDKVSQLKSDETNFRTLNHKAAPTNFLAMQRSISLRIQDAYHSLQQQEAYGEMVLVVSGVEMENDSPEEKLPTLLFSLYHKHGLSMDFLDFGPMKQVQTIR